MNGLTEHAEQELRDEIERLRTERAGDQHRMFHYECIIDEQAKKITEVVAFLDEHAKRMIERWPFREMIDRGYGNVTDETHSLIEQAADQCRAMAKKLRGET